MRRFRRPRSLPKSPRSWCARCSRITLMRRSSRSWRSPCRTSRSTRTCNWNFHLGLKMRSAAPGPKEAWRAGWPTAPLTGSAIDFGWEAVGYGSVALGLSRSVPDAFRELAEKNPLTIAAKARGPRHTGTWPRAFHGCLSRSRRDGPQLVGVRRAHACAYAIARALGPHLGGNCGALT